MSRPSWVEIDLSALQANYASARTAHGGRVFAVLKANAYGHGAQACAQALAAQADGFAVAFVEEALALREAGISAPILVLEGAFGADDVQLAALHQLWLVVHQASQVTLLEQHQGARLHVWLKVDSGMHRVGFAAQDIPGWHARLSDCPQVAQISTITHLARADELGNPQPTEAQLHAFDQATRDLPGWRSVSNSAAILAWPQAHRDWGRAGLMLYGVASCASNTTNGTAAALRPVMTLKSRIFAQRWLEAGQPVGYGAIFTAQRRTRVGLVAIGYADGYPRSTPNGTPVAVAGHLTQTIGRVSMDMMTVDLTDLPEDIGIGAEVELWGRQVSIATVAAASHTIAYELMCHVQRVPRVYRNA